MRTFLSAVSLFAAAFAFAGDPQLTPEETSHWKSVEPSVVMVLQGNQPYGAAALITKSGLFLAHRSIVTEPVVRGRLPSGKNLQLKVIAFDAPTQLVLLQAEPWDPDMGKPAKLPTEPVKPGELLFAVIPSGVIRAEFVNGDRLGVLPGSRRLVPLGEIHFEAPLNKVGGALVFSTDGALVGAMQATLGSPELSARNQANQLGKGGMDSAVFGGSGSRLADPGFVKAHSLQAQHGPQSLTVAFVVGQDALAGVVQGFRSKTHEVLHPTIGIVCSESGGAGALVERVQVGSEAEKGGLKPNDIIIEIAGDRIRNQVDFAKTMMKQTVGSVIQITVLRDGKPLILAVTVDKGQTRLLTPSPLSPT